MATDTPDCFLILMADQLAAAWLPAYGHPLVQVPHLSELARGGAVFDSAYSAYPLCAPPRAAMLSGRHASAVEVYDTPLSCGPARRRWCTRSAPPATTPPSRARCTSSGPTSCTASRSG